MSWYGAVVAALSAWGGKLGYLGIFLLMALESSFIPFPSEVVVIPAGAAAAAGEYVLWKVVLAATAGALVGAWVNYFLARLIAPKYLTKLLGQRRWQALAVLFQRFGGRITFWGRLVPVLRQYISLPAGFFRMSFLRFSFFTFAGAFLWSLLLALIGYWLPLQEGELWLRTISLVGGGGILLGLFIWGYRLWQRTLQELSQSAQD